MHIVLISDPITFDYSEEVNTRLKSHQNKLTENIVSVVKKLGHNVECVIANNSLKKQLLRIKPEIAINLSTRRENRSGQPLSPALLEKLGIPFTGSSSETCNSAFNKNKAKHILQKASIPTPNYFVASDPGEIQIPQSLSFPLFVKPIRGGCSQGIDERNLVYSRESCKEIIRILLEQNNQMVLVEEFLAGREFSVGVLGNDPPFILPILEIIYDVSDEKVPPFRSFKTKMTGEGLEKKSCPAILSVKEEEKIKKIAMETYKEMKCRDYARIDIRCNIDGAPQILEVNALPNMVPNRSSITIMAKVAGISYEKLISNILNYACKRYSISYENDSLKT